MKWSWRIGQVAGIGIYVHGTFLIFLGWIAFSNILQGQGVSGTIGGLLFFLCLFTIIVLHELGHALTAKRFGIRTRDITLLPIGGVARLERIPDNPRQELLVALAGPAVNVALAGVMCVILALLPHGARLTTGGNLLTSLMWVNVGLAVFNLLPAFPMDGGRALRACLAMRMDYVKATRIAAALGQGMALLFGFLGLFLNPMLVFIALFVWIGAGEEEAMVQVKAVLSGIPIEQVMITEYRTMAPSEPLTQAIAVAQKGFQQDFPVVKDGQLMGMLTLRDLLKALAQSGQETTIGEVMQKQFEVASPSEMLESVFTRLRNQEAGTLPIVQHGQLVGLVTRDNLGEFLMVQSALHDRPENRTVFA